MQRPQGTFLSHRTLCLRQRTQDRMALSRFSLIGQTCGLFSLEGWSFETEQWWTSSAADMPLSSSVGVVRLTMLCDPGGDDSAPREDVALSHRCSVCLSQTRCLAVRFDGTLYSHRVPARVHREQLGRTRSQPVLPARHRSHAETGRPWATKGFGMAECPVRRPVGYQIMYFWPW